MHVIGPAESHPTLIHRRSLVCVLFNSSILVCEKFCRISSTWCELKKVQLFGLVYAFSIQVISIPKSRLPIFTCRWRSYRCQEYEPDTISKGDTIKPIADEWTAAHPRRACGCSCRCWKSSIQAICCLNSTHCIVISIVEVVTADCTVASCFRLASGYWLFLDVY